MNARPALLAAALSLVASTACRTSSGVADPRSLRPPREMQFPGGVRMTPALVLLGLEEDRRFRWVPPDSLLRGLTSDDVASVGSPTVLGLRESVETVVTANGWRLVPDSADYEIAIFTVARTELRRETRTEQAVTATTGLPRCDESKGQRAGSTCSNNPVSSRSYEVGVPLTVRNVFHVVRRRADGAVRVWVNPDGNLPAVEATVARDLLRLFLSRDPD